MDVPITKHFDIQPEVLYARSRSTSRRTAYHADRDDDHDDSFREGHFRSPHALHHAQRECPLSSLNITRGKVSFEFDPYLNMTVGSTLSGTVDLRKDHRLYSHQEQHSSFTVGFTTGAEYRFDFGLFVEARISQAVMSACKNSMDVKVRGNFITFGLGFTCSRKRLIQKTGDSIAKVA